MIYLIIVSLIWGISFTLIKGLLTNIDPNLVAFIRLFISLLIFLPFLKIKNLIKTTTIHFIIIGAIQYGLMYVAYIYSYQYLQAYEIAILTIFTPIFIVLISDFWGKEFVWEHWIKATLAISGTAIILYSENTSVGYWKGILLIQISNFLFALGQIYYKKLLIKVNQESKKEQFPIIYFGAVIIAGMFSIFTTDFESISINTEQWYVLIYLGAIASGLCFFLWNYGITKVETGTIAVMNNIKIPLGILFAIIFLDERINYIGFIIGTIIILTALYFHKIYNVKKLEA